MSIGSNHFTPHCAPATQTTDKESLVCFASSLTALAFAAASNARQVAVTVDASGNCRNDHSSTEQLIADGRITPIDSRASTLWLVPPGNSGSTLVYELQSGTLCSVGQHASVLFVDETTQPRPTTDICGGVRGVEQRISVDGLRRIP